MTDLQNLGMKTLHYSADHYGLSLILGGAEVSPWDLAEMYTGCVQKLTDNNSRDLSFLSKENPVQPANDAYHPGRYIVGSGADRQRRKDYYADDKQLESLVAADA